ncbi:hypothetical protein JB92DRAFT_2835205 [Gautieria morchelliformis]|nr:hypothetical protein JB92DRAFT_2835205 [Gautieria morchelliformis]
MVDVDGCQTDAVELKAAAAAYLVNGETESRTCRWTCWRQWGSQRHRWELASGGPGSRESAGAGANEATGGSCRLERMRDVDRRAGGVPGMAAAVENLPRGWDFNAGGESRGLGRMATLRARVGSIAGSGGGSGHILGRRSERESAVEPETKNSHYIMMPFKKLSDSRILSDKVWILSSHGYMDSIRSKRTPIEATPPIQPYGDARLAKAAEAALRVLASVDLREDR